MREIPGVKIDSATHAAAFLPNVQKRCATIRLWSGLSICKFGNETVEILLIILWMSYLLPHAISLHEIV